MGQARLGLVWVGLVAACDAAPARPAATLEVPSGGNATSVLGQAATPISPWSDDATVARGRSAFVAAGCATCHAGADFTNNASVDVGTGQALQVPQLHGLGFRAPYMHDGCAATLLARFSLGACGGDERHGVRSALGPADFPALLAYLDTL